jgi:hypothetical protein
VALGTPYKFCGTNAGTGSATLAVLASATSVLGDALHLWLTSNENDFPTTCSDAAGNTYSKVGAQVTNGADNGQWYESLNSAVVTSGVTLVTAIYTNATSSKTMSGLGCSGVATTSALDQAPTPTTGSTGSPSITSGSLSVPNELCLAGVVNANSGGALTWTGSFASPVASDSQHPGSTIWGSCAALVVSSTTAVTASGSITAAVWGMVLITLEAAATSVTSTGSVALKPLAMAGTEAENFPSTGRLALSPLKMAGTGAGGNNTSTGGLVLSPLAMAGTAQVHIVASGGLALAPLKLAGTAAETFASTGSLRLQPLKMAGTGAGGNNTSTGGLALQRLKLAGTAAETFAATGSLRLAPLRMAGQGAGGNVAATGSVALAPLAMRGIGAGGAASAPVAFVDDYRHRMRRRWLREGWGP